MAIPITVDVRISAAPPTSSAGFANVWYDIRHRVRLDPLSSAAGIGYIRVDQGNLEYDPNGLAEAVLTAQTMQPQTLPPGFVPEISTTDTVLAYHFGAGVGVPAQRQRHPPGGLSLPGRLGP